MRTTFTTKEEQEETIATLEPEYENTERSQFVKYDDIRRVLDILFDHTNGVKPSTTPGYSIRLNGSPNERNGIAQSLSVMPGDKIDMQVFGKYIDPNTPHPDQTAWDDLMSFAADVAIAAQQVVIDGIGYTSGTLRLPPYSGVLTDPNESLSFPKAHLNWVIFDRDNKFLDGGARQLQGGAEDGTDVAFGEITKSIDINEPGYVYIWLSNTSDQITDVYFDDFKVIHTKSPVVQQEEYYPFGLRFNSYVRENSLQNKLKLFQEQEHTDELELNWESYKYRNYQSDIGRFFNIDPMTDAFYYNSPYAFSENKVTTHRELEGLEAFFIHGSAQGNEIWTKDLVNFVRRELTFNKSVNVSYRWDYQNGLLNRNWILNDKNARLKTAQGLAMHVMKYKNDKEPITLVGHSHGGNVAILAAKLLWEQYQISVDIINHNTPAFNGFADDENPENNFGINTLSHYYTEGDGVVGAAMLEGANRKYKTNQSHIKNILLTKPLKSGWFDSHMLWNMNQNEVKDKKPKLKEMDKGGKHHEFKQDW